MRIAIHVGAPTEYKLRLAAQMGVSDIVSGPPPEDYGPLSEVASWTRLRNEVAGAGLTLSVIESISVQDCVMLGRDGRDEEIERFTRTVRAMGTAGIPVLCYNWMPAIHVVRTSRTTRVRGGALATGYEHSLMETAPLTGAGRVSLQCLWESLGYFLRAIVPVAEEVGVKLAMHPDDPPISPIRGIDRILSSPEGFQKLLDLAPSASNGITFCQGCFSEMGVDVPETIRRFGDQNRIYFAHFRNVRGAVPRFHETFHDSGDTDMYAAMRAYRDSGFDGPMRPDHYPVMESEEEGSWAVLGRLYAVGYMKGLIEGVQKGSEGR